MIKKLNYKLRTRSFWGGTCVSIQSHKPNRCEALTEFSTLQSTHIHNVCIIVCIWSSVCSLRAFSFHKLHGLLFDGLDALRSAVLLLVLQVALEEELDLFHRDAQVDHTIKERPAGDRKNSMKHSLCVAIKLVFINLTNSLMSVLIMETI